MDERRHVRDDHRHQHAERVEAEGQIGPQRPGLPHRPKLVLEESLVRMPRHHLPEGDLRDDAGEHHGPDRDGVVGALAVRALQPGAEEGVQGVGQVDHVRHPLVSEPVEDPLAPTLGADEAAPAQRREVVGDLGLRLLERRHQLAHGALLVAQQRQDSQPGGIAEAAEVLRQQVHVRRVGRQAKGSVQPRAHPDSTVHSVEQRYHPGVVPVVISACEMIGARWSSGNSSTTTWAARPI